MDATIRNLDEHAYRELRACAVMQGRNVGDLLSEAMRAYLSRVSVSRGRSTLRALQPEPFPEGNERLSREIDVIVYGDRRP